MKKQYTEDHQLVLVKCHCQNPSQSDPRPGQYSPEEPEPTAPVQPAPLDIDDDRWDVFLPDDNECDPVPEPGDFWIEFDPLGQGVLAA